MEFENNASDIMNPSLVTNTDIAKIAFDIWYNHEGKKGLIVTQDMENPSVLPEGVW